MEQIAVRKKCTDYIDVQILNRELGHQYSAEKTKERIRYVAENTKDVI